MMAERLHREYLLNAGIVLLINALLFIILPYFMMAQKMPEPAIHVSSVLRIADALRPSGKESAPVPKRSEEDVRPVEKLVTVAPEHLEIPLREIRPAVQDISLETASLDINPRMEAYPAAALPGSVSPIAYDQSEVDQEPITVIKTTPVYPYRARKLNLSGEVRVKFLVDANGQVRDIRIIEADPPGVFDKSVIDALSSWRFQPGRLRSRPVVTRVTTTIVFRLEDAG